MLANHNKISQTGEFIKSRHPVLQVLEVRSEAPAGSLFPRLCVIAEPPERSDTVT